MKFMIYNLSCLLALNLKEKKEMLTERARTTSEKVIRLKFKVANMIIEISCRFKENIYQIVNLYSYDRENYIYYTDTCAYHSTFCLRMSNKKV